GVGRWTATAERDARRALAYIRLSAASAVTPRCRRAIERSTGSTTLSHEPASPVAKPRLHLAAADPGGFAARTALRAALALAASALLLLAFGHSYGDPVLLAIVGGEVAMMTSSSVSDASLVDQRITLVLCVAGSAAAVMLAAFVAPMPWLAIVVLCALIVWAVLQPALELLGLGWRYRAMVEASPAWRDPAQRTLFLAIALVGAAFYLAFFTFHFGGFHFIQSHFLLGSYPLGFEFHDMNRATLTEVVRRYWP